MKTGHIRHLVTLAAALCVYVAVSVTAVMDARATVTTTTNYKRVDGDGSTTAFTFNFRSLQASDVKIYTVDTSYVATLKTSGVDYTLVLNTGGLGGTVTFGSAPSASVDVLIVNTPSLTQGASFTPGGPFNEADLETALDKRTLTDTAQEEEIARSLKLRIYDPLNVTGFSGIYIAPESGRAGKLLQWDAAGTGIEAGASSDDIDSVVADLATVDAAATAASSSASAASVSQAAAAASASAASSSAAAASASAVTSAASAATVTAAWRGAWVTSTAYAVGEKVSNGGSSYIATAAHTSGASTRPGVGASWTNFWDILAAQGAAGAGTGDMLAANNLSDLANKATSRATLGVALGVDVQAYDDELAAVAGLTSAADKVPYFTGSGTAAVTSFTTAGRALVDDADATAQRTTLGLGTASTKDTGTGANNIVVRDGSGNYPAGNGSAITNLTGIPAVTASATGKVVMGAVTMQWMTVAPAGATGTVSFSPAFSDVPYYVGCQSNYQAAIQYNVTVPSKTASQFTYYHQSGATYGMQCFAVGPT